MSKIFLGILKTSQLFTDTVEAEASNFQLPTSVKLRFLQETELRADWQAGKWWEGRCTIPGNASPNPGHPTTSAVPPKSCQFHQKVAGFTQKLPSTKSCDIQPILARFIQMLLVSTGKCRFHQKAASFTQSFSLPLEKFHPQIAGVKRELKVSPNICHCQPRSTVFNQKHLKIAVFNQKLVSHTSSRCDPKVATLTQKLPSSTKSCWLPYRY